MGTFCLQSLYRQAHTGLRGAALRAGVAPGDAEDAVQEAFARLLAAGPFPAVEPARAYLYQAVRSIAVDGHRRAATRKTTLTGEEPEGVAGGLWDSDPDHERAVQAVAVALEGLKGEPGYRELAAVYREGMTLQDIATRDRAPLGTVAARVARARGRYRSMLCDAVERARA